MMIQLISIEQASKKWTMPIRNWKTALNRFMIFRDRLKDVILNLAVTQNVLQGHKKPS